MQETSVVSDIFLITLSAQVIFDQMLSASFDMDTIHSTSGAVYAIICYHKVYTYHVCMYPLRRPLQKSQNLRLQQMYVFSKFCMHSETRGKFLMEKTIIKPLKVTC